MSAPTLIPVALHDTIETQCLTLLGLFNTEQSALQTPPGKNAFNVISQMHLVDPVNCIPGLVNGYVATVDPLSESSGKGSVAERATLYFDLYAIGHENPGVQSASLAAHKNLLYLAQQVRWCLVRLVNYDFGLGSGYIARRPAPRFDLMVMPTTDTQEQVETGRVTLDVEYAWIPEDLSSTALTEVFVTILGIDGVDQDASDHVLADFTTAAGTLG